jgi:hypothetical protein
MRPLLALDWLRDQWASGKRRKRGFGDEQLEALRQLYLEWERVAADGPPDLPTHMAFLERFAAAYNQFYRAVRKGMCIQCYRFFIYEPERTEPICTTCLRAHRVK